MLNKFIQIFIVCSVPLVFIGCLEGLGGCAADYEENRSRLYSISLNGEIDAIEQSWSTNGHGSLKFYGLDDTNNFLYYTKNSITSPESITRLNFQTGSESTFILDENGERFYLSPDGNRFIYEKNPTVRNSDISVISLTDSVSMLAPRDSTIKSNRSPKWISQNLITYNGYDENGASLGIFKVNLMDSTIIKLTDLNAQWGYDVSESNETVVLSARTRGEDGLSESSIYIKKKTVEEPIYAGSGTYPKIIPTKEKFIFEAGNGIIISDFNGNKELLYPYDHNFSGNKNLTVSPNGDSVVFADNEGLFSIDIETKKVTQLISKDDFISDKGHWESIRSTFQFPVFSQNGGSIFFLVDLNYFDDGC